MKTRKSLRWRITLVLTCLISLTVCLAAVLTYGVYLHMEKRMMKKLVQTESTRLVSRIARFGGQWEHPFERDMGPSMYAWAESDNIRADNMPPVLRDLPVGLHELDQGDSIWHVAVAEAMDGNLYVLYDSVVVRQQMRQFTYALMGIVLGCSVLSLLVSRTVARWLTTPLNVLAERLERWAPSAPDAALSPHANEADRLMDAFNRVQHQMDASIADQREFSANLHHEIRTPLTVIRSDAELMLTHCVSDPAAVNLRLERIVRSVQEIDQSLESTFSIACARFEDKTPVSLHACVDDIIESLALEAGKAGLHFVNAVTPTQQENLSHHALLTVMRNIMRNAVLHAAPAELVIESVPHGLNFTDSGAGIAPAELSNIFDRYFSNRRADQLQRRERDGHTPAEANQTGLGLAIAKRVCVMQGWSLDVASPVAEGRGTRFTLLFRQATLPPQTAP